MAWRGDHSGAGWRSLRPHSGYFRQPRSAIWAMETIGAFTFTETVDIEYICREEALSKTAGRSRYASRHGSRG